mmetsp:Transcript_34106/g.106775  ORF Transcript_34106/g.106775 Transcript_34106/m.106775 type:complete len:130 (-) Transcript_34106:150-539(-)
MAEKSEQTFSLKFFSKLIATQSSSDPSARCNKSISLNFLSVQQGCPVTARPSMHVKQGRRSSRQNRQHKGALGGFMTSISSCHQGNLRSYWPATSRIERFVFVVPLEKARGGALKCFQSCNRCQGKGME